MTKETKETKETKHMVVSHMDRWSLDRRLDSFRIVRFQRYMNVLLWIFDFSIEGSWMG